MMDCNSSNIYIAHSANLYGKTQTINEHSLGVSMLMREFALSDSFADLYEFCGLIHDMGKYSTDFQKHISGENNKVKHSIYGAIFAIKQSMLDVAIPIYGHHTGLPNRPTMLHDITIEQNSSKSSYDEIINKWEKDAGNNVNIPDDKSFRGIPDVLQKELFLLFFPI